MYMRKLIIQTGKVKEVVNITSDVEKILEQHPAKDGLCHLFLRHTTAALTTAYMGEDLDLVGAYEIVIPSAKVAGEHTHHTTNLPAHVASSFFGPSLVIPVKGNRLLLGTFQSVVLVELNGPQRRELVVEYKER